MRLRYTLPALADLDAVVDTIAAHAPQGPQHEPRRLRVITELLLQYPGIGRRTDDPAIRRMAATPYPYAIFYKATDTEIIIHAVRHLARDPSGMPGARA